MVKANWIAREPGIEVEAVRGFQAAEACNRTISANTTYPSTYFQVSANKLCSRVLPQLTGCLSGPDGFSQPESLVSAGAAVWSRGKAAGTAMTLAIVLAVWEQSDWSTFRCGNSQVPFH